MGKRLLLSLMVCAFFLQASGQGAGTFKYISEGRSPEDKAHVIALLTNQSNRNVAAKTTVQKKRLIAYSYVAGGMLEDTSSYFYSAGRGSSHPHLYSYQDVFSPREYGYILGGNTTNRQYIKCDSSMTWDADNNFNLVYKRSYTYDQQQRASSQLDSNVLWYYSKVDLNYDAMGRLSSYISYDTTGGSALIPKMQVYIQYDAQGNRVLDSGVSLITTVPLQKVVYTYDNNDNLIARIYSSFYQGVWNPYFRYDYLYDNSDRLLSYSAQYYYMGGFVNNYKDSFQYTGTNPGFSTYTNFFWDSNNQSWTPDTREIDIVNAQGLVDTYYLHKWTGVDYDTMEKDVVVYDIDGLVQYVNGYVYNGNGIYNSTPYDQQTMYYETYIDLDVENIEGTAALSVYPNPSAGLLNVKRNSTAATTGEIYGSDGKLMLQLSLTKEIESINIGSLTPGTYYLMIRDTQAGVLYRKSFIKL
jgi:hypothetical protein